MFGCSVNKMNNIMKATNSSDFKVKTVRSSSASRKLGQMKSQAVQEIAQSTSVSKLQTKKDAQTTQQLPSRLPPRRPSTGRRTKEKQPIHQPEEAENQMDQPESVPVQEIIQRVLSSSHKIRDFMQANGLSLEGIAEKLRDPIFTISLANFVNKNSLSVGLPESFKKLQRFVLDKLESECEYTRQTAICGQKESKIFQMIDERLKRLQSL